MRGKLQASCLNRIQSASVLRGLFHTFYTVSLGQRHAAFGATLMPLFAILQRFLEVHDAHSACWQLADQIESVFDVMDGQNRSHRYYHIMIVKTVI